MWLEECDYRNIELRVSGYSVWDNKNYEKWKGVYASVENLGLYPWTDVPPGGIVLAARR